MNNNDPLNELENTKQGATYMMWIRTIIYVLGLLASIVSFVLDSYGQHQLAQVIAMCGAFFASVFGVVYNPVRLNQGGNK